MYIKPPPLNFIDKKNVLKPHNHAFFITFDTVFGHTTNTNTKDLKKEMYIMKALKEFGKFVKNLRTVAGLSQEKLAELCNISVRRMVSIEQGNANLRFCNLIRLCTVLDIDCGELAQFYISPYEDIK